MNEIRNIYLTKDKKIDSIIIKEIDIKTIKEIKNNFRLNISIQNAFLIKS